MRQRSLWLAVLLLLLATWLGARGLNADPIWIDELWSLTNTGIPPFGPFSPADIWRHVAETDPSQTPGYYLALYGWHTLVGSEPAALRALSILFGLLALAFTYRLGTDLFNRRVGLYALVILSTSAFFVFYLHEMRMYAPQLLFVACVAWAYLRVMRWRGRVPGGLWLLLLVGCVGLLYAQHFGVLVLGAFGLYHLLLEEKTRRWWQVTGVFALAGAFFLPWVSVLLRLLGVTAAYDKDNEAALGPAATLATVARLGGNGSTLLFAGASILALTARGRNLRRLAFLIVALIGLILLANGILRTMHAGRVRYLLPLWPLLAVFLGVGFWRLARWPRLARVAVAAWGAFGLWGIASGQVIAGLDGTPEYTNARFPIHLEAQALRSRIQPNDYVLNYMPRGTSIETYDRVSAFYLSMVEHRNLAMEYNDDHLQSVVHAGALADLSAAPRVWFAFMPEDHPPSFDGMERQLNDTYLSCGTMPRSGGLEIRLYARSEVCCIPDMRPPEPTLRFGELITLVGSDIHLNPSRDAIAVTLAWQMAAETPLHVYSVTLQLFDARGDKVGQTDYGLEPGASLCQPALLQTSGLAPGTYDLRAGVYAWQTLESLMGVDLQTGEQGTLLPVGQIRVEASQVAQSVGTR